MFSTLQTQLSQLYRKSGIPLFLNWWIAELFELVPHSVKRHLQLEPDRLLIEEGEDSWLFRFSRQGQEQALGTISSHQDLGLQQQQIKDWIQELDLEKMQVWFLINQEKVLQRKIAMPLAAADKLKQIMGFELDRFTPFKADEVLFDVCETGRSEQKQQLDAELVVTPRENLQPILQALNGWQLGLYGLSVPTFEGQLNLLPLEHRPNNQSGAGRLNKLLAITASVLLIVVSWNAVDSRESQIQKLDEDISVARKKAAVATRLKRELTHAVNAANDLTNRKRSHPLLVEAIYELTETLPDDAWVQRLEYRNEKFQIQGYAVSANELIKKLDEMDTLKQPEVVGAITEDQNSKKELFNIKLSPQFPLESQDAISAR